MFGKKEHAVARQCPELCASDGNTLRSGYVMFLEGLEVSVLSRGTCVPQTMSVLTVSRMTDLAASGRIHSYSKTFS